MKSAPVIILAVGTNALGILRALKHIDAPKILVTDLSDDFAARSRFVDITIIESTEIKLVERMREQIKILDVKPVVLVGTDNYLSFMEKYRSDFEHKVYYQFTGEKLIETLVDKRLEVDAVKASGAEVPTTWMRLKEIEPEAEYPIIIKPALAGHQKIISAKNVIVDNKEELDDFLVKYADLLDCFIAQEVIPGEDSCQWVVNGLCGGSLSGQEFSFNVLGTTPSHYGVTSLAIATQNESLIQACRKICDYLDYSGPVAFDFKKDPRDGKFKYIELNPRLGMSNGFDTAAGINSVENWYLVLQGKGNEISDKNNINERLYFYDMLTDTIARMKDGESFIAVIRNIMKVVLSRPKYAVFSLDDPMPAWSRLSTLFTQRFKSFCKRLAQKMKV